MKTKLHLLFFAVLFSVGLQAQVASMTPPTIVVAGTTYNATVYYSDAPEDAIVQVKFHLTGDWSGSKTSNWKTVDNAGSGIKEVTVPVPTTVGSYFMELHFMDSGWQRLNNQQHYYYNIDVVTTIPENTFNETTNADWNNVANWSLGTVPVNKENVIIPSSENAIIGSTTGAVANNLTVDAAGSLSIASGGSLKTSGTSTGNITYNLAIPDSNWHLVASPVAGQAYNNAWVAASNIASGSVSGSNRGIATYQNGASNATTGNWVYMQENDTETFGNGVGYSMKSDVATTTYSFTGMYPTLPVTPAISQGVASNNWNLVGNPAPAYLDVAAFTTANSGNLSAGAFQAIYTYSTSGGYTSASGYIHPGQGFFVNSGVANGTVSITEAMLSHQTGTTFQKSDKISVDVSIMEGNTTRKTYLEYRNDGTLGLDPGKDIGKFNGVDVPLSIYTNLLENNENIAFERQALPNSKFESMVIPVGIKAAAGKEITIAATSLNLPEGIKVYLEDKEANVVTNLNETDYTITLSDNVDGVGRFFLRTSASSVLSTDELALSGINIYKTNNATLRIVGLQQGNSTIKVFNILGKQMINTTFNANGVKEISLPKLATGVYIVQLQTAAGTLNKKIILE